jgi:hypothetical protein
MPFPSACTVQPYTRADIEDLNSNQVGSMAFPDAAASGSMSAEETSGLSSCHI